MPLDVVIGTQWGDEGKGRIVDLLAAQADIVARFNGGDNAGHTVTVGSRTFKLHLIPSGIIHPHTIGVMGNGMVINPVTFINEVEMLQAAGVAAGPDRLRISYAAHLITPAHRALDAAQEAARGQAQIGTTGRGIGPAYTGKTSRNGLRMEDMLDPASFYKKMKQHVEEINMMLKSMYRVDPLDENAVAREYAKLAVQLAPYIADTGGLVHQALRQGKRVLAEGAQGTLLDLDHGTYPYVTSSYATAAGALVGLGVGIVPVERVIGVTKAFQTRVGAGPFPTEVFGKTAERLRGTGKNPWDEFGTTTGRPRRVGWLDGVLLRYALRVNGVTELMVTKMDILSGLSNLRLCTAYQHGSQVVSELPMGPANLAPYEPIYEELAGWEEEITAVRRWEDLPEAARAYACRLSEFCGVPVRRVSVGPEREQVVEVPL
ncbi:adenylosuccinate synthetase [Bellilinea caldifistulae]|uniref:Adenylosuccinate synthetase n=1 Tax=Bellilinea caldifistulae TaxID=360411 RepID=A0A0P6Y544_9CHLR|nr:adenylosuccinate synthase [Bellilinea caldifistulae]KPL76711.1 adenylosuccinate synthetase [Bellilinea caldifistulae]GAP08904.1 adenylosuccinate synthetase [Bellilinea caldifistulae]